MEESGSLVPMRQQFIICLLISAGDGGSVNKEKDTVPLFAYQGPIQVMLPLLLLRKDGDIFLRKFVDQRIGNQL